MLYLSQTLFELVLPGPSRQIYTWMKFLTPHHLELHLKVTQRIRQIAAEVLAARGNLRLSFHRRVPAKVEVELVNIAGLYKVSHKQNTVLLEINEGFICAGDEVLTALVQSVFLGKSSTTTRIIKAFSFSEEYSEMLLKLDIVAEVNSERVRGRFYDLDAVFERVNHEYFAAQMTKPRLSWSHLSTTRKLGHYEPARDRVVLSLTLDDQRVPQFVVEFVMYHELLHKQHGEKWVNDRLFVHTSEFRQDERKFKQYEQAEQWLKKGIGMNQR